MRRALLFLLATSVAAMNPIAPSSADPGPGGFSSSNVTWVANIPIDAPGVGARVVEVGAQKRLYVTGASGLMIYDVTNATVPVPLGAMALPHFENEDVDVSADGSLVLIGTDDLGAGMSGDLKVFVVDASVVQAPHLVGVIDGGEHTVTCAVADCSFAYGSSGRIFDLRDPAAPSVLPERWTEGATTAPEDNLPGAHDLQRDAAGFVITDSNPRYILDVSDPAHPVPVAGGSEPAGASLGAAHSNLRPRADLYAPAPEVPVKPGKRNKKKQPSPPPPDPLRDGELVLASSETNLTIFFENIGEIFGARPPTRPTCPSYSGAFSTWSARGFDDGAPMQLLDVWRPKNGNYQDGNAGTHVLGCSSHWFDESDGLVALGAYENGTRLLSVDKGTGAIEEVGFFQPVNGSAFASYWIDEETVYTIDFHRGIDILKVDRSAPAASPSELAGSYELASPSSPVAIRYSYNCSLQTKGQKR